MKRSALCLISMMAAVLAGCPNGPEEPSARPAPRAVPELRPVAAGAKIDSTTHVLVVAVKAVSIELPIGMASRSEEIWSYLDEEPVGAAKLAALGRNGVRIGLGRADSWPDLAEVFKRMTGRRFRQSRKLMRPGTPAKFELNERPRAVTIFTSHSNRTLSGADYPAGRDLLRVVCTLDEDDPSTVLLTGMLQIESGYQKPTVTTRPGRVAFVAKPEMFDFPEITFQLSVAAKDFLVFGPGAQAHRPSSVGQHFLMRRREGVRFETVVVLVPEVLAAPLPPRR